MKPFYEMTTEEKKASCERMLKVLTHPDWSEVYLMFVDASNNFRQTMETAPNWDTFIEARAKYEYIRDVFLKLPEDIKALRDELDTPESQTNEYED